MSDASNFDEWIGVDLDGTLAVYDQWRGPDHIGDPVPLMVERVRNWIANDYKVKIFTARASDPKQIPPVKAWLKRHHLPDLEVTCSKDFAMAELWDDRCVTVRKNTGECLTAIPARKLTDEQLRNFEGMGCVPCSIEDVNNVTGYVKVNTVK